MSETLWKQDPDQLTSAKLMLAKYPDDVDVFDIATEAGIREWQGYFDTLSKIRQY